MPSLENAHRTIRVRESPIKVIRVSKIGFPRVLHLNLHGFGWQNRSRETGESETMLTFTQDDQPELLENNLLQIAAGDAFRCDALLGAGLVNVNV